MNEYGFNQRNNRHKVFVSYHHDNDQEYRDLFEGLFSDIHDIIVSQSVQIGDIDQNLKTDTIRQKIRDEYLRDSTVTVVLIGAETWKRKHVDWEIGASIRQTQYSSRSGLLGILLPTYPIYPKYYPYTIPRDFTITYSVDLQIFTVGILILIACNHGYMMLSIAEKR